MRHLAMLALLLPSVASAAWPNDIVISDMLVHDGVRSASALTDEYRSLIQDLGTIVSNQPILPANTVGPWGFDFSTETTFAFIDAYDDDSPTPWQRVHPEGEPDTFLFIPTMTARKGLPLSMEVGVNGGWIGGSHQGVFGGYGRLALVEGYKPYPDLSFQVGYSGYVANPELDLGVMDFQVSLGSKFKLHRIESITHSHFAPYVNFSLLRITASPHIDADLAEAIGTVQYGGQGDHEAPLLIGRLAGGFQITTGKVLGRLAVSWAPSTLPTFTFGMGFEL